MYTSLITMQVDVLIIWLVIFVIFLVVNITQQSTNFGVISGIWVLLLGLFIITDGIQILGGINQTESVSGVTVNYQYIDATLPYSTYAYIWGVILILVGVYILYANLLSK